VWAWGNNCYTQLGLGKNAGNFVNQPERIYDIASVIQVSCGYEHSAALTDVGDLYTWGHGEGGLLGHGDLDDQSVPKMITHFKKKNQKVQKI